LRSGSQTRLLAILLAVVTLGAIGLAIANLVQESTYPAPTDGARWIETQGGLRAYIVSRGSAAEKAGIRQGDVLTAINGTATPMVATATREMYRTGVWGHANYSVTRQASADWAKPIALDIGVILEPTDRSDYQVQRLIGLVYLAIGLYVLFRRWTAPKSTHFYVFCLMSFVSYAFHYTGAFDGLDLAVFWANIQAAALQPALFLHFALSFGERPRRGRSSLIYAALYIPAAVLILLRYLSFAHWSPTMRLELSLDKIGFAYFVVYYLIAAAVFWSRYRREQQPLQRQQLKWLSRGTLLTILPFALFYVIPFLLDTNSPGVLAKLALLSLVLLPLTFSWAIVRYRLMDVDLIFKRGVTYTLVTGALVGLYFGAIALSAEVIHTRFSGLGTWGLIAAIIITGLLFDPLKNWIQSWVDRVFDPKRLDYRETLIRFGRDLNAQTDLRALVDAIVLKLPQTLLVTRVAVFLPGDEESGQRLRLVASHGLSAQSATLDLGFLDFDRPESANHIFFESPNALLRLPESQRLTASALDLNYYIACRAARHQGAGTATVAILGLGRTTEGDFLSSEDMVLLESLAGYIGIAIQNAQLYRRLERKVLEYERLHDFNENIVESINVGVFAVDLEDRIESWNAQMEVMLATPRADALGHALTDVFPAEFISEFDRVRAEQGASTLYKFRLPTPTTELRTANITIAPLLNRDFQAVGRIVIVDDITDRINMETQLTQSEKLSSIGLLAAGVAHEVNTPLAVISSYAQMLGKQLRADEATHARLQPVLEKITQQTFRASEIVNGLLNFSRMGSSEFSRVDLNSVVRDTTLLLEHQLRSANVEVVTSLDASLPEISGNRGKLQQVLVNFILNAKDALQGRESARIRVATHHEGAAIHLRVEDNGIGMSEAVIRRIYDPFFTTKSNPAQGQRKGTGLGLAVTYGIVQEHAGTIDVSSTVGEGTIFEVVFPAAESPGRTSTTGSSVDEGKVIHV
jgi:two-component system, NtrC family, sensor kinase